jgi:hypothetical protein
MEAVLESRPGSILSLEVKMAHRLHPVSGPSSHPQVFASVRIFPEIVEEPISVEREFI